MLLYKVLLWVTIIILVTGQLVTVAVSTVETVTVPHYLITYLLRVKDHHTEGMRHHLLTGNFLTPGTYSVFLGRYQRYDIIYVNLNPSEPIDRL